MRRHLTPSLLISLLALFAALGGTGYAVSQLPRNSVGSKQLKKDAVSSPKVRDGSLLARDFKAGQLPQGSQGEPGPQGVQGAKGDPGAPGADGASGAAVFSGGATGLPSASPGIENYSRGPVNGVSAASAVVDVAGLSPARAIRVRDLSADVAADVPAGGFVAVRFVVNPPSNFSDTSGPTGLDCTITGTAGLDDKRCSSAEAVTVPAASVIFMRVEIGGGSSANTSPSRAHWGMTVEPVT